MKSLIAAKEQVLDTIRRAKAKGTIVAAPVWERGALYFREVRAVEEVVLDGAPNALNSPKSFLLPPREELALFELEGREVHVNLTPYPEGQLLLVGIRPCDLEAISLLDRVFGQGQFVDDRYIKRRERMLLWGFACTPGAVGPTCFCNWFDIGPGRKEGADLFSTDLGKGRLLIEPLTVRGAEFLSEFGPGLEEAPEEELSRKELVVKQAEGVLPQPLDIEAASRGMARSIEIPFWANLAKTCLSCGVCAFFCPCCFCFFISDETAGDNGVRVRGWDSCCFPEYVLHADGHNPRPDPASRLRHRFLHKFVYSPQEVKAYSCTGCGRCVRLCPVGVNTQDVLARFVTMHSFE